MALAIGKKLLIIPTYQDEVAKINSEIISGVTEEMRQLQAFYLGVTNEWLEAMALAMGIHKKGGEKECFPLERNGQVEHISLPALYRLVCREMGAGCKVKVLKTDIINELIKDQDISNGSINSRH